MGDIHEAISVITWWIGWVWNILNLMTHIFTKNNRKKSCFWSDDINVFSQPYPMFMSLFLSCQKYGFGSQTHPTYFPDVTNFTLFFFEGFPYSNLNNISYFFYWILKFSNFNIFWFSKGSLQKKKSKISDIRKKGRVGWDQKTYFWQEINSDINIR